MARESDHLECANRTQKTIVHLLADKAVHSPWLATTAFYKALHIVEAAFFNDPAIVHTSTHGERELILKRTRKYAKIAEHYGHLSRAATNARYLSGCASFDDYLSPDEVLDQILKHHLKQLENAARRFLKQPGNLVGIESAFSGDPSSA